MDGSYVFPKIELLSQEYDISKDKIHSGNPKKIEEFYKKNNVSVSVTDEFVGPLVTEYAIAVSTLIA